MEGYYTMMENMEAFSNIKDLLRAKSCESDSKMELATIESHILRDTDEELQRICGAMNGMDGVVAIEVKPKDQSPLLHDIDRLQSWHVVPGSPHNTNNNGQHQVAAKHNVNSPYSKLGLLGSTSGARQVPNIDNDCSVNSDNGMRSDDGEIDEEIMKRFQYLMEYTTIQLNKEMKAQCLSEDIVKMIKRTRRRNKNRVYARRAREKKMGKLATLRVQKQTLAEEVASLKRERIQISKENEQLRSSVAYLETLLQMSQDVSATN